MKHAYLILAHNAFDMLQQLINMLDDVRNDIYIHIDKKTKELPSLYVKDAHLYFTSKRIDVYWGDISVVEAEYVLFEEANINGNYRYYHLLSGADLPLKSQNYIHNFFQINQGKEFIGFSQYDYQTEVERKVQKYHFFPKYFRFIGGTIAFVKRVIRYGAIQIQNIAGYKRHPKTIFKKGTQWVSVTGDFVAYLIANKSKVMDTYHHTFCSDEIYKQTLCWNSSFRACIYNEDNEALGCMRKIGWKNGHLIDWTIQDYDNLVNSNALFARKFNNSDKELIQKIKYAIEG